MSITENTTLPSLRSFSRWGRLDRAAERRVAEGEVKRMATRTPSVQQKVVTLSGGNQQKVVLGKWLAMSPRLLILDEPTRGIDVGARAEIYRHVAALAKEGIAVVVVSSDMEEVIGLCDRVLVMRERRLAGALGPGEITQARIGTLMTGAAKAVAA
jgi:ribose transport system ATP-binding protein